jgi:hypothetical protein
MNNHSMAHATDETKSKNLIAPSLTVYYRPTMNALSS